MKKKYKSVAVLIATMFFTSFTFAANTSGEQDLATFSDPSNVGGDPGSSPINDHLIPMMVLGVLVGLLNLKTKIE